MKKTFIFLTLFCFINQHIFSNNQKPSVLLLHFPTPYWGGIESHTLNRYTMLLKNGHKAYFLIIKNSLMEQELQKRGLNYQIFSSDDCNTQSTVQDIYQICKKFNIDIVLCSSIKHFAPAKEVSQRLPIKIVWIQHSPISINSKFKAIHDVDGAIGVSPIIAQALQQSNKKYKLGIKHISYIPPFFNEEKFLNFKTEETREVFFKNTFNIDITKNVPILCTVANMYKNLQLKNHPLLFAAIKKLIYEKHKPIEVMLAGDGDSQDYLKQLAKDLAIDSYVHFLGRTIHIPALLYHSDFHVLPSSKEAFGQVTIEAALMKKPAIGANNTGPAAAIKHGITGLLFKNNNVDDLVEKIAFLLDNPSLQQEMGLAAYNHARENFSNQCQYEKLNKFFQEIIS